MYYRYDCFEQSYRWGLALIANKAIILEGQTSGRF